MTKLELNKENLENELKKVNYNLSELARKGVFEAHQNTLARARIDFGIEKKGKRGRKRKY